MHSTSRPRWYKLFTLTFAGLTAFAVFSLYAKYCEPAVAAACPAGNKSSWLSHDELTYADRYYSYSETRAIEAHRDGKKLLLYFHAPWCANCTSLDLAIAQNPSLIPEDVVVLRLAFDASSPQKKRYAITIPHTFVWIDEKGNIIRQWVGGDERSMIENTSL